MCTPVTLTRLCFDSLQIGFLAPRLRFDGVIFGNREPHQLTLIRGQKTLWMSRCFWARYNRLWKVKASGLEIMSPVINGCLFRPALSVLCHKPYCVCFFRSAIDTTPTAARSLISKAFSIPMAPSTKPPIAAPIHIFKSFDGSFGGGTVSEVPDDSRNVTSERAIRQPTTAYLYDYSERFGIQAIRIRFEQSRVVLCRSPTH